MGSTKRLLLVHRSMERVTLSERVNIMLTPQLYTLKREVLPVKYHYQAQKIAPSLFIGLLEEESSYKYLVFREGEVWVCIAYNPVKINHFLLSKGIKPEQVAKLFFAQQAFRLFDRPVLLDEREALVLLDSTVVVLPQAALDSPIRPQQFDDRFTPRTGVSLEGGGSSLLTAKQTMVLTLFFTLFSVIFFIEGWRYGSSAQSGAEEIQELLEAYPVLQSSSQRANIAEKYRTIDTLERKKRAVVKSFSMMIFKGVTLTSLTLDSKQFKALFACSSPQVAKRFSALVKKEGFRVSQVSDAKTITVEGVL